MGRYCAQIHSQLSLFPYLMDIIYLIIRKMLDFVIVSKSIRNLLFLVYNYEVT